MPIKLLYYGDPHIRGTNPRNRLDSYSEAWKAKHRELWEVGRRLGVDAFIQPGDTFDLPDVANGVLNDAADVYSEAPAPIYTTIGNHDIPGHNVAAYANTSLRLLERMVPQLEVIKSPDQPVILCASWTRSVQVTFTPYSGKMDVDGYGYSPDVADTDDFKVHVAHGMLLDHTPPFDRYTLLQEVKTTANYVFTGHDHTGYGLVTRPDGVTFCNPGSLTRLTASLTEIARPIRAAYLEIYSPTESSSGAWEHKTEFIELQAAKPGEEILDRSRIEQEAARQYAMESFAALVQTAEGEKIRLNIDQIVEAVAEKEGIEPGVVKIALEKIAEARVAS